jgi:hypothetical protein
MWGNLSSSFKPGKQGTLPFIWPLFLFHFISKKENQHEWKKKNALFQEGK